MNTTNMIHSNASLFAKIGYAARGVVYLLMGTFSIFVAFGMGQIKTPDSKSVLREILDQKFGNAFLIIIAVGLFCYSFWRLYQAITERSEKQDWKKIIERISFVVGAITHFLLAYYAINLIFYFSTPKGGSEKGLARELLVLPFGEVITGIVALIIAGFGVYQIVIAVKEKFCKDMEIPADHKKAIVLISKFGLIARGIVFMMIGFFFMRASFYHDSSEAGGVAKAWVVLKELPYGDILMGIVAAGFIAFGIYGFVEALYKNHNRRTFLFGK